MANSFAALNSSCISIFGQPVKYQQGTGDPFQVFGILEKLSDEEQHQDGVDARLFVLLSDFPSRPDHGDELVIEGAHYTVFEVSVDPTGSARLRLRQHS
jgi:hypothetical protein